MQIPGPNTNTELARRLIIELLDSSGDFGRYSGRGRLQEVVT